MKVDRQKKVSKDLRRYKMTFGFHEPYRVLFDPTFIHVALESKIHIKEQLCKILGTHKVTPMVTSCGLQELKHLIETRGKEFSGALKIAEGFYQIKCGCGEKDRTTAAKAAASVANPGAAPEVVEQDSSAKNNSVGAAHAAGGASKKHKSKSISAECICRIFQTCPKNADGAALQSVAEQIVSSDATAPKRAGSPSSTSAASAASSSVDASTAGTDEQKQKDNPAKLRREDVQERGKKNYRCWFVATQDEKVKQVLRQIPGTPIFTLNGQVPRLEPFSKASNSFLSARNESRIDGLSEWEINKLPVLQNELRQQQLALEARKGKKKKMRGHRPNPLSCMKKKKKPAQQPAVQKKDDKDDGEKKKRTRNRKRKNRGGAGAAPDQGQAG
ncbi:unnamed protein product [Amoebophrya sp. A120]|nr:unnamed protein product [Amoebophrya sp. A120]|eukprot:GSA120T00006404001.1